MPITLRNPDADPGNLDPELAALVRKSLTSPAALQAALFGLCWPNESALVEDLGGVVLQKGESLHEATTRHKLTWVPGWLIEAGHRAVDAAGQDLGSSGRATATGPITWDPPVRLCRLDDQVPDSASVPARGRRLAGEVAVAALWRSAAAAGGISADGEYDVRPVDLSGGTRGARFKNALLYVLRLGLPPDWKVEGELRLDKIYGLHLRRDVGGRSSDIAVFDDRDRLTAVISSKWTWRSDRGTEAAQMVPLNRYRPEVPYVLVTAEFPRMRNVARESVEDRAYHLSPQWVAAFLTLRELDVSRSAPAEFPSLQSLQEEARRIASIMALTDVSDLADDLVTSGRRG